MRRSATVVAGAVSAESDFSTLQFVIDDHRSNMSNLTSEKEMQSKQAVYLQSLSH